MPGLKCQGCPRPFSFRAMQTGWGWFRPWRFLPRRLDFRRFFFIVRARRLIICKWLRWGGASGSASQRVGGSAGQRVGESAGQRVGGSAARRVSGSAGQRVSGSASRRVSGSASQRVSESAGQRLGGAGARAGWEGAWLPGVPGARLGVPGPGRWLCGNHVCTGGPNWPFGDYHGR